MVDMGAVTDAFYKHDGLAYATTYDYNVTAYNDVGEGPPTPQGQVWLPISTGEDKACSLGRG